VGADLILVAASALLGLCLGSFLNVCILRLPNEDPKRRSLLHPPSTCPQCKQRIAWRDNVPVFSWLWLRGKCRWCHKPISMQYPLIEAVVAVMWVVSVLYYGFGAKGVSAAVFGTILLGIGVIDARHKVIPDELSLGGLVLGLALSLAGGFAGLLDALLGAGVGLGVLWLVRVVGAWVFKQEAMGMGDVILLGMIGAFVGWRNALLTIFFAAILGSAFYLPLMVVKIKQGRRYELPFGVFLAVAAVVTFVFGDAVISWYADFLKVH